jgi:ribose transport system ATP-binding protein
VAAGIGYVPSERKVDGAVMGMSVADNMTLAHPSLVSTAAFCVRGRSGAPVSEWLERFSIKTPGPSAEIINLSGGNQQKVVLAKWSWRRISGCSSWITPTRGLDVGAKSDVYGSCTSLPRGGLGHSPRRLARRGHLRLEPRADDGRWGCHW